ncbi:MAG: class I SAM-dependent methyltransferase [Rhizomicrobium sp.]
MSEKLWSDVDSYLEGILIGDDPVLEATRKASLAAGLPDIAVSATQGKAAASDGAHDRRETDSRGRHARRLQRDLDGARVACRRRTHHAGIRSEACRCGARQYQECGSCDRVTVITGAAIDTLPTLTGPFDFSFIDADKKSNPDYFQWALKLSRRGSVIVVDNVVREGQVIEANSGDANVEGIRRLNTIMAGEQRVSATAIQTVGVKGHDGLAIALVVAA